MNHLKQIIQAILFASPHALSEDELVSAIQKEHEDINQEQILAALEALVVEFRSEQYGMEIQKSGMGYSFVSKPQYYPYIVNYIETIQKKRLSKSAMETLSIIAFQPDCTKVDIEQIRGVSADYAIERLIERELIEISGRKDTAGHPSMYRITTKFLDYFGIDSLDALPRLETVVHKNESEIGVDDIATEI